MTTTNLTQLSIAAAAACALVGCVSADGSTTADDGDDQVADGKADAPQPAAVKAKAGYYEVTDQPQSAQWIQAINLHGDGTFEATLGNGVSNLSGHLFTADGTFTVDDKAATITLTYAGFNATAHDVYSYKTVSGGLSLLLINSGDDNDQAAFTITKGPRPDYVAFGANGEPTQNGELVAGAPLLIEYAESRSACPGSVSLSNSPITLEIVVDDQFGQVNIVQFPVRAVNGYYRALYSVPTGSKVAFWFQEAAYDASGNSTCTGYDSNHSQNYVFDISAS